MLEQLKGLIAFGRRHPLAVFHHDAYRLPAASFEQLGVETRRPEFALQYLLACRAVAQTQVKRPEAITYEALGRVHSQGYLDSLLDPKELGRIFGLLPGEAVPDELLRSVRLACGGTLAAARHALEHHEPALNLLGGFHHAGRSRGGGFCALNDVAVAVATLRSEGLEGPVAIIDLDAHPPDGTADCLPLLGAVWLGSLSGSTWGSIPGAHEVLLAEGAADEVYLEALRALLEGMPKTPALAFVLAGGDVLAGDPLGKLGLSLQGARARDLAVIDALDDVPQVWLPAGGYGVHAWKVLAGTGLALTHRTQAPIPPGYDPLEARFRYLARTLGPEELSGGPLLSEDDVAEMMGQAKPGLRKLLGYYTREGVEIALERYGLFPHLRRLGYRDLRAELEPTGSSERARIIGDDVETSEPSRLIELDVERRAIDTGTFLFVNWLSLRNPRARFSNERPMLPGQDAPGLGLAREMTQILALMAKRLVLDGVAFRPSWYHMAYAARHHARFVDAGRQGRFEALSRDLRELPLLAATQAVAQGRVRLNGAPYTWEADPMVQWLDPEKQPPDREAVAEAREASHFTVV